MLLLISDHLTFRFFFFFYDFSRLRDMADLCVHISTLKGLNVCLIDTFSTSKILYNFLVWRGDGIK